MNKQGQIVRVVVMLVVMINSIFLINDVNFLPYTDDQIASGVSSVALVVSEIYNHYKNNDYTPEAEAGTRKMKQFKQANKKKNRR